MSALKVYVAQLQLVGRAEHLEDFHDLVMAALNGDEEARAQLRASVPLVTAIGPEWFEEEGE